MAAHPQIAFGLVRYAWWPAPATRKAVRLVLAGYARRRGLYLADIVELEQAPVRDSLSLARLVAQINAAVARHGHAVLVSNQPVDPAELDPDLNGRLLTVIVFDPFNDRAGGAGSEGLPATGPTVPTVLPGAAGEVDGSAG